MLLANLVDGRARPIRQHIFAPHNIEIGEGGGDSPVGNLISFFFSGQYIDLFLDFGHVLLNLCFCTHAAGGPQLRHLQAEVWLYFVHCTASLRRRDAIPFQSFFSSGLSNIYNIFNTSNLFKMFNISNISYMSNISHISNISEGGG